MIKVQPLMWLRVLVAPAKSRTDGGFHYDVLTISYGTSIWVVKPFSCISGDAFSLE